MKSLTDIKTELSKGRSELFAKYPLKSLAIFGSFARNEQTDKSDVDLLVEFNDRIGIRFIDLAEEIEQLIGKRVDLVSRGGIKPKYFKSIESDLIYV